MGGETNENLKQTPVTTTVMSVWSKVDWFLGTATFSAEADSSYDRDEVRPAARGSVELS